MHGRFRQRGLSLIALILTFAVVIVVVIFGMKVVPSFLEYRAMRGAIEAIAREQPNGTPADARRSFQSRSAIDDFSAVKPSDLEISKEGGSMVISFAYRKEVPLFRGVGLYIDYSATAGGQ